ncbi:serine protease Do-like HtrA isoform X1 [Hordeum vulgare subsp. vulgare]|uniref:serine protease Do-like HtrA isoform X1 n=1 Tax=Hordeum vulgare subsp. vulgare TaxID=112509 RepID=UPI000B4836D4|nr:serine protease Do-like HtrA isoform X1 [Hordeum vulgare subsp. vulgare]
MAADPLDREKKKMKMAVDLWSDSDEESPVPSEWAGVNPDSFRDDYLAKVEQDRLDEQSAPRPVKIATLDYYKPPTMFHTVELFPVSQSGSKAVLRAAKFLLGVSSSLDGEPLRRCSGFWVDWDEEKKTGLVLTTARLIRTKDAPYSVWSGGEEYAADAHVTVHLLNGTSAEGQLVYLQPHYDLAFLSVQVDQPINLPSLNEKDVEYAQEVFRLGRDDSLNLRITYARAEYLNPTMFERHHNVYFRSPDGHGDNSEYDNGGPVINLCGEVVGMVNVPKRFGSFVPSSILLNCLDSWKKYQHIPRPHLGMMFKDIKLLEPAHVDMLWRTFNIDDGLIVQEVSGGSAAEKSGIQKGDIIESFNGKPVSSTIELENVLMSICKCPLDVEVHIYVGVFHILKEQRSTIELTAKLSELGEIITRELRRKPIRAKGFTALHSTNSIKHLFLRKRSRQRLIIGLTDLRSYRLLNWMPD